MMKKNNKTTLTVLLIAAVLVVVLLLDIWQVFRLTSDLTLSAGRYHLESISGELESTIRDAEQHAMRLAISAQPYLGNREEIRRFVYSHKAEVLEQVNGCFNVYMAGTGWAVIPDFNMPDDYVATERDWYKGAKRYQTYVSAPYKDAMTGNICFSVSVMLSDQDTVLALDYTMDPIQAHIKQMYADDAQNALIVTGDGIIAGCSDETLLGRQLSYAMPEYASIFSLVKSRGSFVTARIKTGLHHENLFATRSGFGWYLIVSESDWNLYKNAYIQFIASGVIALLLMAIILIFVVVSDRRHRATQKLLLERDNMLRKITAQLMEPLNTLASYDESSQSEDSLRRSLAILRTAGRQILDTFQGMQQAPAPEKKTRARTGDEQSLQMNKRFRTRILLLLALVVCISVATNVWVSVRWGNEKIRSEVNSYDYTLSEWVSQQKSILDMFCSVISTNPDMLNDYEGTIAYLDRITGQYPEISDTFIANPNMKPTVFMNNGYLPPEGWLVEERQWWKDVMASESGWTISAPYYDVRTGLYCVTFVEQIHDAATGEFLGNFGIDFILDKLIGILGGSYSDTGYAFLTDNEGVILNHPYGSYQMTEQGSTNISELNYSGVQADGRSTITVRDYDGALRIITAKRNVPSRFTVYVAESFAKIYAPTILSGILVLIALLICAVMVYRLLTALMKWQDEMNARMREAADTAIAAGQAKSRFLAQMSHEIRTPINAVLGMNEMILRESKDPSILEYASNIQTAGKTLLSLINSILDFSKIEEGKMEIIPVKYDTASVINNLVVSISERARAKNLELLVEADPELPAKMIGDDVRLSQVIMNLLTNAVKYTEKGSVRFCMKGGERKGGSIALHVTVQDTGIGIRQEDLPRLFESFERLDEVRNHSIEGTGLGMSIVTRLLDMMGSRLEVESEYGKGSTFSFTVTQQIADETPIGDYARRLDQSRSAVASETLWAEKARILVVDDNEMNLKVAKNLLKLFGIVPDLANSGFEAIELMRRERYNVVFLDHMMPKMDGVETLHELKKEALIPEDTKVIVLTANAVLGAKEQYLKDGFDDYLSKPIDVGKLEELLIRILPKELYALRTKGEEAGEAAEEKAEAPAGSGSSAVDDLQRAGFDTAAALRFAAGDADFYLELASGFAEGAEKNLPAIREDFEKKDWADYQIRVHALKSTAKQIGANELSELALRQEMAAKERNIPEIEAGAENLLSRYAQTVQLLRDTLRLEAAAPEEAKEALSLDELRAKLGDAKKSIDNFEAESALEILKPLAAHSFTDPAVGDALQKIIDALEGFDTFTAEEELNGLIGRIG